MVTGDKRVSGKAGRSLARKTEAFGNAPSGWRRGDREGLW